MSHHHHVAMWCAVHALHQGCCRTEMFLISYEADSAVSSQRQEHSNNFAVHTSVLVHTVDDDLSALSEHSSDEQGLPPPIPTQPNVIMVEGREAEGGESLAPSEAEYGNPVTPATPPTVNRVSLHHLKDAYFRFITPMTSSNL